MWTNHVAMSREVFRSLVAATLESWSGLQPKKKGRIVGNCELFSLNLMLKVSDVEPWFFIHQTPEKKNGRWSRTKY